MIELLLNNRSESPAGHGNRFATAQFPRHIYDDFDRFEQMHFFKEGSFLPQCGFLGINVLVLFLSQHRDDAVSWHST